MVEHDVEILDEGVGEAEVAAEAACCKSGQATLRTNLEQGLET